MRVYALYDRSARVLVCVAGIGMVFSVLALVCHTTSLAFNLLALLTPALQWLLFGERDSTTISLHGPVCHYSVSRQRYVDGTLVPSDSIM